MISDVLSEAVNDIDRYVDHFYFGELAVWIKRLRNEMDAMRDELDWSGSGSTVEMGATRRPIKEMEP
jgi:hypothetical protein